jgi:predicted oxidoreductase (fatty acid repression mutant protein)
MIARSGVKLTSVSQTAVQSLIELQSDVVTSALTDVALRLERATRAENIVELVREQIELTPATRARMAEDATRVVTIVKVAGRDFRNVARHAYESIVEKEVEAPKATVRRKTAAVKRAAGKTAKRARKAA